ncbi:MAG: transaldolase [Campylobacteraceae bacterium]|jgi:twitching motility protein PilT|nr:transaldolase [Campylobacteraceae bacterium]
MAIGSNNFSVWCDFLERDFLLNQFNDLVDSGVVSGITSNPVIFKNAILSSKAYNEDKKKSANLLPEERYEVMAIDDIKNAARLLLRTHTANELDGFVSIEVNPLFADDAAKMTEEAKRLFKAINMPNVMMKIPATVDGYETIKDLIVEGINVNATLVFSPLQAGKCLQAIENGFYIFQRRNPKKHFPKAVISVFVSRFDRKLDPVLETNGMEKMKFGIMNASYIYQLVKEQKISNVRCLFASTGVSDKSVKPSYYITKLLYQNAINTAPLSAIENFMETLDTDERACPSKQSIQEYFEEVESKGINIKNVYSDLLNEGLEQFKQAFKEMLESLKISKDGSGNIEDIKQNTKIKEKETLATKEEQVVEETTVKQKITTKKETPKEQSSDKNIAKEPKDRDFESKTVKPESSIKPSEKKDNDTKHILKEKVAQTIGIIKSDIYAISFLKRCLESLISYNGSDLHIKSDASVKGRVNGEIITVDNDVFTKDDVEILAQELLQDRYEEFARKKNIDFIYKLDKDYRFRVNMFYQTDGISAAFRVIPLSIPTVESLELPEVINDFSLKRRGLILVTGPTGCGKSTTLATIIDNINQTSQRHIITIEDPIEFIYKDIQSIINQRSIGQDAVSFSDALIASLREDPDVIMVGEMRDVETIRTAIRAAETGHLVLSTLHTLDAKETIGRIISMFQGSEQAQIRQSLSSVLEAVISQRLVRRKGGKGRIAAVEILVKNARVEAMITQGRESEIKDSIEKDRDVYRSQSFNQALLDLYINGNVNYHEALYAATSPTDLKILLDNYDIKKSKEAKVTKSTEDYTKESSLEQSSNITVDMSDIDILDLKR